MTFSPFRHIFINYTKEFIYDNYIPRKIEIKTLIKKIRRVKTVTILNFKQKRELNNLCINCEL